MRQGSAHETSVMFSALRIILVVGVIFYLSPVRQGGETRVRVGDLVPSGPGQTGPSEPQRSQIGPSSSQAQANTPEGAPRLQSLWQALPDSAKRAVVDEVVELGTGLPAARLSPPADASRAAAA